MMKWLQGAIVLPTFRELPYTKQGHNYERSRVEGP